MASEATVTSSEVKKQSHVLIKEFSHDPKAFKKDPQLMACLEHAVESTPEPPPPMKDEKKHKKGGDSELRRRYRTLYEPDTEALSAVPDEPDIDVQHKKLEAACNEFWDFMREQEEKHAPKKKQVEEKKEGKDRHRLLKFGSKRKDSAAPAPPPPEPSKQPQAPPTPPRDITSSMGELKSAINIVYSAQSHQEENRSKAGKYWTRFCRKMDCHSNIFAMFPAEDRYTSLFCGAIKVLVQATINHDKISEELAKSLDKITHHISLMTDHLTLWGHRSDITLLVSSLYAYVFHFLRSCLSWLLSSSLKRALHSLNESFADVFTDHVDKIQTVARVVRDKAQVKSQAEVREVRYGTEEVKEGVRHLSLENEQLKQGNAAMREELEQVHMLLRSEAEERKKEKAAEREQKYSARMGEKDWDRFSDSLGQRLMGMLESNLEAWYLQKGATGKKSKKSSKKDAGDDKITYTRHSLQLYSAHLVDHTTDFTPHLSLASTRHTDMAIIEALQTWSASSDPCRLWIRGCDEDEGNYPSSISCVASTVLARALRFDIPVLGFYCESPLEEDSDSEELRSQEEWDELSEGMLVNLVYTLIRQIIALLPRTVDSKKKLSRKVFKELDGTLESWDEAINVLKIMLRLAPKTCLIVLDGLDRLTPEWGEHVQDVLMALGKYVDEDSPRSWKLLFTTSAGSDVIDDFLSVDDIVDVTPSFRRKGQLDIDEELDA